MQNFEASIEYIHIQGYRYEEDTRILGAMQNLIKYVSEYCSDSLDIELHDFQYFTLNKPLPKLQKFFFLEETFENAEALELMPNLRTLTLLWVPRIL